MKDPIRDRQIVFWRCKDYTFPVYTSISKKTLSKALFNKDSTCLVLDAGCGESGSIDRTISAKSTVIGIDLDRAFVKKAKMRNLRVDEGIVACLTCLPLIDGVFDIVVSQDVLEHVKQKRKVIQEISRVTKRGGRLVGSTTNLLNPVLFFDTFAPKFITHPLIQKYVGFCFERHSRVTQFQLQRFLFQAPFQRATVQLVGYPLFNLSPSLNKEKLPWFAKIWVLFDKLNSNSFLKNFKEIILFEAMR